MLFKPPWFHIKTTKTCWPTHNRQFFERTEILFLGSFPRNCCNSSFWSSQEVGELPDLWNKVLCHLVRLILPLNGFLVLGVKCRLVQPVQFSSNSSEYFAFLPYRSCFLQLLWRVLFILHTLCLLSGSLTTMSLACSPIASPVPSYLLCFCKLRTLNLALSYHHW